MKYFYLLLIITFSPIISYAKCMPKHNILSEVQIIDCNGVSFYSSPTLQTFGDDIKVSSRMDKQNKSVLGTIITAKIINSESFWKYPFKSTRESKAFEIGSIRLLFVNDKPETVCPETIDRVDRTENRRIYITLNMCCDTSPKEGLCLLPYSLPLVTEEPNPEKWYKLREGDTLSK